MLVTPPTQHLPILMKTATLISSSVMKTEKHSSSETQDQQSLPFTPNKKEPLPLGFRMLATSPARPLPISMATAILICSSAITTEKHFSSATAVLRMLLLIHEKEGALPLGLQMLAPSLDRPLPMPMATVILISSSATTAARPSFFVTPQLQAPPLLITPQKEELLLSG